MITRWKMLRNNFRAAFAMFSVIPVPAADWEEGSLSFMLCFFPWIGAVCGGLSWLAGMACRRFGWDGFFAGVLLTMIPMLVTGGIHLDGLMDTADALACWQGREQRLRILKDSHTGAFAVMRCSCFLLVMSASAARLCPDKKSFGLYCLIFFLARSLSALGVMILPKASPEGTVAEFSRNASEKKVILVLAIYIILAGGWMILMDPLRGCLVLVSAGLVWLRYRYVCLKYFGGTTGDLSGYFLCLCEAAAGLVLALLA